jgi:hypothetical protein
MRAWRAQPRRRSPQLYWGLLALAAVLDTFALGLFFCLLTLPVPQSGGRAAAIHPGPGWWSAYVPAFPMYGCGLLAAAFLAAGGVVGLRFSRPAGILYAGGLILTVGAVAVAAGGLYDRAGPEDWLIWTGCLAAACGLVLEATYRHGVLAFTGSGICGLVLLLAGRCPARYLPALTEVTDLLAGDTWQAVRGLSLLGGGGALALAWGLGNLTLGLILLAPRRLAAVRTLSGATYRVLGLAAVLLAAGTLVGRLPSWEPVEMGAVAVLVGFALLLNARFAGWVQDLGLALGCALGFLTVVLAVCSAALLGEAGRYGYAVCALAWVCCAVAANAGLAVHAVHRYWFTCPTTLG